MKEVETFKNKQRDYFFDNAKFFLILLVVLFHAVEFVNCGNVITAVYKTVYLFHMPAFVFISGYFIKYQKTNKIAHFVLLYIIFQTILMLIDGQTAFFNPAHAMWFLIAIVVWKIITPFVICYKARYVLPIAVIIALLAGYDSSIGTFFALSRIIVFYPFFLIGYYFKKDWIMRLKQIKFKSMYICTAFLLVGSFLVVLFLYDFNIEWVYCRNGYQVAGVTEWYAFLIRLGFMIWGLALVFCFFVLVPCGKMLVFSNMGRRTLQAYLLHITLLKLLDLIPIRDYIGGTLLILLYLLAAIAVAIILMLPLPKLKLKKSN